MMLLAVWLTVMCTRSGSSNTQSRLARDARLSFFNPSKARVRLNAWVRGIAAGLFKVRRAPTLPICTAIVSSNQIKDPLLYQRTERSADEHFRKLDQLKSSHFTKWTGVDRVRPVTGTQRFPAAQTWLDRAIAARQAKWTFVVRSSLVMAIVLSGVRDVACAEPAEDRTAGPKTCLEAANTANAICYDSAKIADERLDCIREAHTAQLECLIQIAPETSAGSQRSEEGNGAKTAPDSPSGTASQETVTGQVSSDPPHLSSGQRARTVELLAKPEPPTSTWVVSETTSPVDFTPLVTATLHFPSNGKEAPTTLVIRCRQSRTELLVRTEGTWPVSHTLVARASPRSNDKPLVSSLWNSYASEGAANPKQDATSRMSRTSYVQVGYQINERPSVRLPWAASADGKTASYKGDAVGLLQSLPEAARLTITVLDGNGVAHEAVFKLDGFENVRQRISATCKWTPAATTMTSNRH
jgi:hypothetical protein